MRAFKTLSLSMAVIGTLAGCGGGSGGGGTQTPAPVTNQALNCNPQDQTIYQPSNPCNPSNPNSPLNTNNPNNPNNPNRAGVNGQGIASKDVVANGGRAIIVNKTFRLMKGFVTQTFTSDSCTVASKIGEAQGRPLLNGVDDLVLAFDAQGALTVAVHAESGRMRSMLNGQAGTVPYTVDPSSSTIQTAGFLVAGSPSSNFVAAVSRSARLEKKEEEDQVISEHPEIKRSKRSRVQQSDFALSSGLGLDPSLGMGGAGLGIPALNSNQVSLTFSGGISAAIYTAPANRVHVTSIDIQSASFSGNYSAKAQGRVCAGQAEGSYITTQLAPVN